MDRKIISAISSAAFVVAALFVDNTAYAMALVLVGCASLVFHWTGEVHNSTEHRMDEGAIYLLVSIVAWYLLFEISWLLPVFVVLGFVGLYNVANLNLINVMLVAVPINMGLVLWRYAFEDFLVIFVITIISFLSRWMEELIEEENIPRQILHSLWHIGIATSLWLITEFRP